MNEIRKVHVGCWLSVKCKIKQTVAFGWSVHIRAHLLMTSAALLLSE